MGISWYFHLFKHKNKLHIHLGYCCDSVLHPWFISNDDVIDIENELSDIDPKDVYDHEDEVLTQRTIAYDVYKSDFNNFDGLYIKTITLLTKDDLKRFNEFVNKEFYGGYMNDYRQDHAAMKLRLYMIALGLIDNR